MKSRTLKTVFFAILAAAALLLTACHKEETITEEKIIEEKIIKEENPEPKPQDIVMKTDDTELAPESVETAPAVEQPDAPVVLTDLAEQIQTAIASVQSTGATVSVYTERLSDGTQVSVGSQPMQSASLIKLYIAGCACEQMPALLAYETYTGETEELLKTMITISDNDSANTLVTRLGFGDASAGMALINQFCQDHGFADTHMGRLMLAPNDVDDNYTSVNDCGKFLREIYAGTLPGAESILSLMRQQDRTFKIPAGVPAGVSTANKTGELSDVENDAAVIFAENAPYILCVMSSGLSDTYAARMMISELSSQVYQYMCP